MMPLAGSEVFSEMYLKSTEWRREPGRLPRRVVSLAWFELPLMEDKLCWGRWRLTTRLQPLEDASGLGDGDKARSRAADDADS